MHRNSMTEEEVGDCETWLLVTAELRWSETAIVKCEDVSGGGVLYCPS